jgi:hypothetical protein
MSSYIDFSQPSLWSEYYLGPEALTQFTKLRQYPQQAFCSILHSGSEY